MGEKVYKCDVAGCGKEVGTAQALGGHKRFVHPRVVEAGAVPAPVAPAPTPAVVTAPTVPAPAPATEPEAKPQKPKKDKPSEDGPVKTEALAEEIAREFMADLRTRAARGEQVSAQEQARFLRESVREGILEAAKANKPNESIGVPTPAPVTPPAGFTDEGLAGALVRALARYDVEKAKTVPPPVVPTVPAVVPTPPLTKDDVAAAVEARLNAILTKELDERVPKKSVKQKEAEEAEDDGWMEARKAIRAQETKRMREALEGKGGSSLQEIMESGVVEEVLGGVDRFADRLIQWSDRKDNKRAVVEVAKGKVEALVLLKSALGRPPTEREIELLFGHEHIMGGLNQSPEQRAETRKPKKETKTLDELLESAPSPSDKHSPDAAKKEAEALEPPEEDETPEAPVVEPAPVPPLPSPEAIQKAVAESLQPPKEKPKKAEKKKVEK